MIIQNVARSHSGTNILVGRASQCNGPLKTDDMTCADILATPSRASRERKNNLITKVNRNSDDSNGNAASRAHSCSRLESENERENGRESIASRRNLSPFICPSVRRLLNNAREARMSIFPDLQIKLVDNRNGPPSLGGVGDGVWVGDGVGDGDGVRDGSGGSVPCLNGLERIVRMTAESSDNLDRRLGNRSGSSSGSASPRVPPPLLIPKPSPLRLPPIHFYYSRDSRECVTSNNPICDGSSFFPAPSLSSSSSAHPPNDVRHVHTKESNPSIEAVPPGRSLVTESSPASAPKTALPLKNPASTTGFHALAGAGASNDQPTLNRTVNSSSATSSGVCLTSVDISSPDCSSVADTRPLESVAFVCPASHNTRTRPLPLPATNSSVLIAGAAVGAIPLGPDSRHGIPSHPPTGSNCCLASCSYLFALPRAIGFIWGKDEGQNASGNRNGTLGSAVATGAGKTTTTGAGTTTTNGAGTTTTNGAGTKRDRVAVSVGRFSSQKEPNRARLCKLDFTCPCVPTTQTAIPEQEVSSPFLCWWGILLLFLICFVGPFIYLSLLQSI